MDKIGHNHAWHSVKMCKRNGMVRQFKLRSLMAFLDVVSYNLDWFRKGTILLLSSDQLIRERWAWTKPKELMAIHRYSSLLIIYPLNGTNSAWQRPMVEIISSNISTRINWFLSWNLEQLKRRLTNVDQLALSPVDNGSLERRSEGFILIFWKH